MLQAKAYITTSENNYNSSLKQKLLYKVKDKQIWRI